MKHAVTSAKFATGLFVGWGYWAIATAGMPAAEMGSILALWTGCAAGLAAAFYIAENPEAF